MDPPLALDVDGTLTRPDGSIDPRVFEPLRRWEAPVVLATGKAFPFPVALCAFIGIEELVIAENGGVVYARDRLSVEGEPETARAVADVLREEGYGLGWGPVDLVNRWRETELAVSLSVPEEPIRRIAAEHDLDVYDTGYAYHVKSPTVTKGAGLVAMAELLDVDPSSFVAIGDSENDASTFAVAGRSFAVANADDTARDAADRVLEGEHAIGTLEALSTVKENTIDGS